MIYVLIAKGLVDGVLAIAALDTGRTALGWLFVGYAIADFAAAALWNAP